MIKNAYLLFLTAVLALGCTRSASSAQDTASEDSSDTGAGSDSETDGDADGDTDADTDTNTDTDSNDTDIGTEPFILAEYQVWHGLPSHSQTFDVPLIEHKRAYDSRDPSLIARHIQKAQAMGIDGFLVNWYGPVDGLDNDEDRGFIDDATAELFRQAEAASFKVALLYDEGAILNAVIPPEAFPAQLQADLENGTKYFASSAYLTIYDRPALFVFPYEDVDARIDWLDIRAGLSEQVTLIDKGPNPDTAEYDGAVDGFYAWVQATNGEWQEDGSEWGEEYLNWFYPTMNATPYDTKVSVGGIWAGFDDLLAPWSDNRFISRQNGYVYDETVSLAQSNDVDYIVIATWNDFEEGTDIEFGVQMIVDMSDPDPEVLIRSTPLGIVWDAELGDAVVQIYRDGLLIYDKSHSQEQPVYVGLRPSTVYQFKIWVDGIETAKWIKTRREDPIPDLTLAFSDGIE